jgi:hypothetical protein
MRYVCRLIRVSGKRVTIRVDTLAASRKEYTREHGSCAFSAWYSGYSMVHTAGGQWVGMIHKEYIRGSTNPLATGTRSQQCDLRH